MEEPTNKQIVAYLKTEFPKFHKGILSMCRNPAYGCALSEDAAAALHKIYPDLKIAQKPSSRVKLKKAKKPENRKKAHRLTLRLDDDAYSKFEAALKADSSTSIQDFLEKVLEDYYDN